MSHCSMPKTWVNIQVFMVLLNNSKVGASIYWGKFASEGKCYYMYTSGVPITIQNKGTHTTSTLQEQIGQADVMGNR